MRKVLIISVSVASVFISGGILAGIAMLQYQPVQQHVEIQITRSSWDR
ncbi:MAG TPA: hypothetical protein VK850_20255 [Candidatus Binatia bacterium]|nr:hypothetical protein [Candidatus Binatia bacterium]